MRQWWKYGEIVIRLMRNLCVSQFFFFCHQPLPAGKPTPGARWMTPVSWLLTLWNGKGSVKWTCHQPFWAYSPFVSSARPPSPFAWSYAFAFAAKFDHHLSAGCWPFGMEKEVWNEPVTSLSELTHHLSPRHDPPVRLLGHMPLPLQRSSTTTCQLVVDLLEWKRRCEMKLEVNATFGEMILATNLSPALYTFSPFALSIACSWRGRGLALIVAKTAPKRMTAKMESFIILSPAGGNFPSSVTTLGPRRIRRVLMHYLV